LRDDLEQEEIKVEKADAVERSIKEWELNHPYLKEVDRYQEASDRISKIEPLKPDLWKKKNETDRVWILDRIGKELSEVYHTPKPDLLQKLKERDELGSYSDGDWQIEINRESLIGDDPKEAIRTYCHEFRHSCQHEQALAYEKEFPVDDPQKAEEWARNLQRYIEPPDDGTKDPEHYQKRFSEYESQPVEKDARRFADEITERVFRKLNS